MAEWQQGLDQRLVRRLQQPLNRKNMGQVLVDRTDKFLTRFSLVEQQFQRWGKFQESNPSAVPIVYAKPTEDPPGFVGNRSNEGVPNEAIASNFPANLSLNSQSDLVIQRRLDPTASSENTGLVEKSDEAIAPKSPVNQTVSDGQIDLIIQQPSDAPGFATPLGKGGKGKLNVSESDRLDSENFTAPPIQKTHDAIVQPVTFEGMSNEIVVAKSTTTSPVNIDLPLVQTDSNDSVTIANSPSDSLETATEITLDQSRRSPQSSAQNLPQLETVLAEQNPIAIENLQLALVKPSSDAETQNEIGDRPETSPENPPELNSPVRTSETTTQFGDVPLVFALPNAATPTAIASDISQKTATPLPIVKTRLEQLLDRRQPNTLPTVEPQNLAHQKQRKSATPLVKPLQPQIADANPVNSPTQQAVQPQAVVNAESANQNLPFTQTKVIQTERRSPTPPNAPNPFGVNNQTATPIVSPQIQAAANPITETFQAAMAEATQNPPVDIQAIAAQVEKKLRRKMVIERERRGQGRWR